MTVGKRAVTCILAMVLGFAPLGSAPAQDHDHMVSMADHLGAVTQAYMDAMQAMNDRMATMQMSGQADVDFVLMMIPHHRSAVDMATIYLETADLDPEIAKLAEEIVASQEREIRLMEDWLARNRPAE